MFRPLCIALCAVLWLLSLSSPAALAEEPSLSAKDIAWCAEVGAFAETAARARDRGVPLTKLLGLPTVAEQAAKGSNLMQTIQMDIYEHSWWSPTYARQQWEVLCVQARRQRR